MAAALFGGSLAIRLLYVIEVASSAFVRVPMVDASSYHQKALAILGGDWLGDRIFYQDPLYPYFLAGLYALFGPGSRAILFVQAAIDSATPVLVFQIARRIVGSRRAALAGVLAATYPLFPFFDALLLKTTLSVFLVTLALHGAIRASGSDRGSAWFGAGTALGLCCLIRGNYFLLLPILIFWTLWIRGLHGARGWVACAWLLSGAGVVVAPVTVRNVVVGGELVLVTSQAGQNFYIGNNPTNDTGAYEPPPFVRPDPEFEEGDFLEEARKRTGRKLAPGEASRFWFGEALTYAREHPSHFARHLVRKLRVFFNHFEVPDNQSFYFFKENVSRILSLPAPTYGLLLPWALYGMLPAVRKKEGALLVLFFAGYAASVILFYNMSRYRMPAVPAMIVLSVVGITTLYDQARARRVRAVVGALLGMGGLYLIVMQDLRVDDPSMSYFNLGTTYMREADRLEAEGRRLAEAGRGAEAEQRLVRMDAVRDLAEPQFRRALEINPGNAWARSSLSSWLGLQAERLRRIGRVAEAAALQEERVDLRPDSADAWAALGASYADLGRSDDAAHAFQMALDLEAEHPDASRGLTRLRSRAPLPEGTGPR